MRLHRLELTGFGPYPDRVNIDFDALAADGLFLLHGDTGAGKTSLLDAVAFALFGAVPGARQEAHRLRCDTTPEFTETRVTLELTVAGQRLRISRTPRYERAKSRGPGRTVCQATANLAWIGTPPAGRAAGGTDRIPEVGLLVGELLGMNADQFFQVVLLPQGEFARFLRADTDQREKLLERLFDTGRFGKIEEWFTDARRTSAANLRSSEEILRRTAAQVAQAAGWRSEVPERPEEEWLAGIRELVDARGTLANEQLAAAVERREAATAEHERRVAMAARYERLRRLLERERHVAITEPERRRWRQQLTDARRAAPVAATAAGWQRAERQLQREIAARDTLLAELSEMLDADRLLVPADSALQKGGTARRAAATVRDRAGELSGLVAENEQQAIDLALRDELTAQLDRVRAVMTGLAADVRELPASLDVLTDALARLQVSAASLDAAHTEAEACLAAMQLAQALPAAEITARRAVDAAQRAIDAAQAASTVRLDLTRRRIENMAAELAGSLLADQPCPVCGSADHPQLAASRAPAVSAADLDRANHDESEARAARDFAEQRRTDAEQHAALIVAQLAGRNLDTLATEAAAAAERLQIAQDASRAVGPARALLRQEQARFEGLRARLGDLSVEEAAVTAQLTPLISAVDDRAARLAAAAEGHPSVAHRRQYLLDLADSLDALELTVQGVRAARRTVRQSWAEVAAALAVSGLPDVDSALLAAGLDEAGVDAALQRADAEAAGIAAQLADLDADPGDEELVQMDADAVSQALVIAATAADSASVTATDAFARASAARDRIAQVASLTRQLRRHWAELRPAVEADTRLARLTDTVLGRGDNRLHVSLRSYVLAAWLREVATAANARLAVLTGGRYSFVHAAGKESRGRTGGLGLEVLDQYSGRPRPTKTLSGGESFLASLALALGLADVVAAQSSSGLLNTLFIDEGFGSLDAESLDLVMETLDTLRGEGRVIGVVSHVDELRQRIPARLRVRRHIDGSSVEMSVAG